MVRIITKIGDVFSVKIDENNKKYFQLIAFDLTQLNSDVIRSFKKNYAIDSKPDLLEIIKGEIEFYAHCITKLGVKLGHWEKIGNIKEIGYLNHILFRGTSDYARKIGEERVKVSEKWYVWNINDEDYTRVGKLKGDNQKAEIGMVMSPDNIVCRMRTGEYGLKKYPGY